MQLNLRSGKDWHRYCSMSEHLATLFLPLLGWAEMVAAKETGGRALTGKKHGACLMGLRHHQEAVDKHVDSDQ